jgi:predicted amidohydrolase
VKIALAQLNPTVGDLPANARRITDAIARAREQGADLVILPELVVCGYPPRDLLTVERFVARCADAARAIGESATAGLTAVIGTPLVRSDGNIANSLLVYRDNALVDTYDKRLLPTYDVFDEDRYFEPGDRAVVVDVAGVRVGLAICEDLWRGEDAGFASRYTDAPDPVAELGKAGLDLLVVPSASPFVLGKHARHRDILTTHARTLGVPVASVNQCGGNDDLIFDGPYAAKRPPAIRALDDSGRVVYCGSFSKSIAPALRVGYVVADWPVLSRIIPQKSDGGTGAVEQMLLAEFAKDFDGHVDSLNRTLKGKADALVEALEAEFGTAAEFTRPTGGIFLWVTLPAEVDTTRLAQVAAADGVAVNPGAEWSADPESGKRRIRICFAHPSAETIKEGMARLAEICHREFGVPARGRNVERS